MTAKAIIASTMMASCSPDPGAWFLELEAEGTAAYTAVPERAVAPGWQKLANEWQVQLTAGALTVARVELLAAPADVPSFDPAHPPPGYGPCHNGHCHAPDGRLVSYDEVAATAGGVAPTVALDLAGAAWDLLSPAAQPLPCEGGCRMGHGRIDRARVTFARLALSGVVRPGPGVPAPAEARPFDLVLDGPLPPLTAAIDLPADNQHPPRVALGLFFAPGAALLDGLDWSAPLGEAARTAIAERLAETPFTAAIHR